MSENAFRARLLRESVAPYVAKDVSAGVTKLSISLPADLADLVRASAAESGSTVSSVIAAALRRALEEAEQRRLDAALALDAEENLAWAEAAADTNAKLLADLEW